MKISVRVVSLVLINGYFILTLFLFFLPDLYANTDLSLAVKAMVEGRQQNLLLGVRPLLIFIATLFPFPYSVVLSIVSGFFYVFSILIGFFWSREYMMKGLHITSLYFGFLMPISY
jgi:hypothetical protein